MKIVWASLFLFSIAYSQTHHHVAEQSEELAIDLDKVPAPRRLDGIGHSHIPIATKSPEAQQWFDQGLALLHCFWDYEALRAFEQAVRLDPDCAMCHWGVANALGFRGSAEKQEKAELEKAKELSAKASDREQRYIRAYADSKSKEGEDGTTTFNKEMESLIDRYPDDLEAKLLYAGARLGGYDAKGDPRPGAVFAQAMLRGILRDHPDNAAANHYWIHAVEGSGHPEWALEAAQKLGKLAPSSGHMVHMPGHIFYRTGDYERARQIFLDAVRVDREYMASQHVAVEDDWNYQHNLAYLIADLAEAGRYREAREYANELQEVVKAPQRASEFGFNVVQLGTAGIRLAIRFGKWDDVIEHPLPLDAPDSAVGRVVRGYRDGLVEYAHGMKAAETGALEEATRRSEALDALLWRMSQEELKDKLKGSRDHVVKILGTASVELRGAIEARKGDLEAARKLLEQAHKQEKELGYSEPPQYARPSLEVLGDALVRAGQFEEARNIFRRVLDDRPRSGWALFGIAMAWEKEGKRGEASKAYRDFLQAWSRADSDLPQLQRAHTYLDVATR